MANYNPNFPFTTAIEILVPTYATYKGVPTKAYPKDGIRFNCSWKTFGGTESITNDAYTVIDTANVETWYSPVITSECRVKLLSTGEVYEILGKPENINMRNQFMKFKVRAIQGGA